MLSEDGIEELLRRLTGQPAYVKSPVAPMRELPPRHPGDASWLRDDNRPGAAQSGTDEPDEAIKRRLKRAESALREMPPSSSGPGSEPWDEARQSVEARRSALAAELRERRLGRVRSAIAPFRWRIFGVCVLLVAVVAGIVMSLGTGSSGPPAPPPLPPRARTIIVGAMYPKDANSQEHKDILQGATFATEYVNARRDLRLPPPTVSGGGGLRGANLKLVSAVSGHASRRGSRRAGTAPCLP